MERGGGGAVRTVEWHFPRSRHLSGARAGADGEKVGEATLAIVPKGACKLWSLAQGGLAQCEPSTVLSACCRAPAAPAAPRRPPGHAPHAAAAAAGGSASSIARTVTRPRASSGTVCGALPGVSAYGRSGLTRSSVAALPRARTDSSSFLRLAAHRRHVAARAHLEHGHPQLSPGGRRSVSSSSALCHRHHERSCTSSTM